MLPQQEKAWIKSVTTTLGLIQRKKSTALGLGTLYSLSFSKLRPLQVILLLLAMNKPS